MHAHIEQTNFVYITHEEKTLNGIILFAAIPVLC